jgi:PHD/YefM family antitoxin component YafN of YafNO toxin-antitoxin module
MNIVPAQEIKRRGIAAVDEALAQGPVHIVKNNRAQYVVLTEERYQELLEMQEEAVLARIKASLEDAKAVILPTFGGRSGEGILALEGVCHGTQGTQAPHSGIQA